jgi:hypothetical protein
MWQTGSRPKACSPDPNELSAKRVSPVGQTRTHSDIQNRLGKTLWITLCAAEPERAPPVPLNFCAPSEESLQIRDFGSARSVTGHRESRNQGQLRLSTGRPRKPKCQPPALRGFIRSDTPSETRAPTPYVIFSRRLDPAQHLFRRPRHPGVPRTSAFSITVRRINGPIRATSPP